VNEKAKKILLVLAHHGEASAYIERLSCRRLNWSLPFSLFESVTHAVDILVCGEGRQAAASATASTLALHLDRYDCVLNAGVALALDKRLKIFDVIKIRTCYAQRGGKNMEFSSYSTSDPSAFTDLVTVTDRITDGNKTDGIENFAQVADREGWSIASVCNDYKINFFSIKCISDTLADLPNCLAIRQQAYKFSEVLFDASHDFFQPNGVRCNKTEKRLAEPRLPAGFYVTKSQKQRLAKLEHSLRLKFSSNEQELETVRGKQLSLLQTDKTLSPKERTSQLIAYLEERLSPQTSEVKRRIQKHLAPINQGNITTKFDPSLESCKLTIEASITSSGDVMKLQKRLENLDFEGFSKLINAENHHEL